MLIDLMEHQGFRDLVVGLVFCLFFECVCIQTLLRQCLCCYFHVYSEKDLPALQLLMEMDFEVHPYFEETFLSTASPSFSPCSL